VDTAEALRMSRDLGLDLVEVAPQERPPVCRIMDYGKHKYLEKKKQKQQTAHQITIKEVRLRPKTDEHDREIKMNRATQFLEQGHKVQFTMLFRGRERQHRDLAEQTFAQIVESFSERAKIERPPRFEGRRMIMVLAPLKATAKAK
jgi:translation initiation factor IF-3